MNKNLSKILTLTLLLFIISTISFYNLSFRKITAKSELPVHNLNTGKDYAAIQEAINDNETLNGHTILVDSGTYYEHIIVNKSLTLKGENKLNTVIDGEANETIIKIKANNVTITDFTLQNTAPGYSAIRIEYSAENNITNNIIKNTYYGIHLYNSQKNTIKKNQALNNSYTGIYLFFSNENLIINCNFSNNIHSGIYLYNSNKNLIHNNKVSGLEFAITISESQNNSLYNNTVSSKESGIRITDSTKNTVIHNNIQTGKTAILLTNSKNNTVSNNTLTSKTKTGILIEHSNTNLIQGNLVKNASESSIHLRLSINNKLVNNSLFNSKYGIQLTNTTQCVINENKLVQNNYAITLLNSFNNSFWHNTITENQYGIQFDKSNNNTLVNNNFINNTQQLNSTNSTNQLDNGIEGNYWDTYNGTDNNQDAIGDTPYTLAENHTDNHPLMGTFYNFIIPLQEQKYPITIISNSTIYHLQFDYSSSTLNFNISSQNHEKAFCRVMIPRILIAGPHTIIVDGKKLNATTLPMSNATHTLEYFTYSANSQKVTIASKTYYDLLEKYNNLLIEYSNINSTYHELLDIYNELLINITLLSQNYASLINNYNQLQLSYNNLNMTYQQLTDNYKLLQDNTRNMIYALAATTIVVSAVLFLVNFRLRRNINKQKEIIESYNPLEIARILFTADVERREAKIQEFEKKHGLKIKPRNTLEDVLKSLEKRRKERGEK